MPTASNIVGFRVDGTVERDDVNRVATALDEALDRHDSVSMLADLEDFEDITVTALFAELNAGLRRLGQVGRFDRVAVIAEKRWLESVAKVENALLPGVEVRAFAPDTRLAAQVWVGEA